MNRFISKVIFPLLLLALLSIGLSGCGDLTPEGSCGEALSTSGYLLSKDCRALSWGQDLPIKIAYGTSLVNYKNANAVAAIDKAIQNWENVTSLDLFQYVGTQDDPVGQESNSYINLIGMRSGSNWSNDPIRGKADEPAKTIYYYKDFLYNADIFFNTEFPFSVNATPNTFDLVSIAVHELGHVLGLGHDDSLDPDISTMNSKIFKGSERQLPATRDIQRIRALYAR
ncbi:MAG: hypothetical protein A2Z91_05525 [Deltaproteobacteria bacterium GWA2_38_16]|nr:MAG: hypothetical protein A2Z91_05525 [Deltaproteobacteria bacterium GWA2_38_16]OGQ03236.1 MAG: hypothetical protein A3D19_04250 [Deltaproteobacteria bacterium RIFCSPHIGHO2_02_FULL_38_15]OGQ34989.1 MAG: hypothetical protein A3A72_03300 [Deltaproteobacteria bacterium RIFCSPLOWO2_01_FULL_38_9]OGQ58754.1 MAG: hypothetical protein A3G92_04175 [Deltaproteobacteria bacterium RIFCSPLOWO2_12_FULL_38_8]HBQ21833.1 hypothetical protein [Deltaproteobacteria bacterium]